MLVLFFSKEKKKIQTDIFQIDVNLGVLFLGPSESIGDSVDLFDPIDKKWKIFRSRKFAYNDFVNYPRAEFQTAHTPKDDLADDTQMAVIGDVHTLAEKIVLDHYAKPSVLINRQHEILHFIGQTEKYLSPPTGKASFNVLRMAREGLRFKLGAKSHQG